MKTHPIDLGKALYDFEKTYFNKYKSYTIHTYSAWQILKGPLYFHLFGILCSSIQQSSSGKKSHLRRIFREFDYFIRFILKFCWMFFACKIKNRVVFFGFANDKYERNEDKKLFNYLIDPFITEKIINQFIYFETSSSKKKYGKSVIKKHFMTEGLSLFISVARTILNRRKSFSEASVFFHKALHEFFNSYLSIQKNLSENFIKNVFCQFYAEYIVYKKIYWFLKPKLIIFSEQIGAGKMAAAQSKNIKTIELQHGVIDAYHPSYIYNRCLLDVQHQLVLPTQVGVFGKLHKDILLKTNFWTTDSIFLLGYYKMHLYKHIPSINKPSSSYLFFPVQWHVFEHTKIIIDKFLQSNLPCQLVIKSHPLEPVYQTHWYQQMANSYPSQLSHQEKGNNIYQLILNAGLVIGFESASLLEAISLGIPCITIGTESFPKGIHSLLGVDTLKSSVRCIQTNKELMQLIHQYYMDFTFQEEWVEKVKPQRSYLYEQNYITNARGLIEKMLCKR